MTSQTNPWLRAGYLLASGILAGSAFSLPSSANDGFGGLTATGLQFGQTDKVAMLSEDLQIGAERISVDYVFENQSGEDVTGEVIFPLPPISLVGVWEGMFNLPAEPWPDNLVDFTALVDGQPVEVSIDRIAVLEEQWEEEPAPASFYESPGEDITARLKELGIPVSTDREAVKGALLALSARDRATLATEGLAEFFESGLEGEDEVWPAWSILIRYHWKQTFPAGSQLTIRHEYANHPPGGIFVWHETGDEYQDLLAARYCIDPAKSAVISKALTSTEGDEYGAVGAAYYTSYVLRTANSWAGPIGTFRLTVDKGAPDNILATCIDGLEEISPGKYRFEAVSYSPDRDIDIVTITPGFQ